jgi:membrane protein YqaA with SNARE-associated domain
MFEGILAWLISLGPLGVILLFFLAIIGNASLFLPLPVDLLLIPLASIDFLGLGVLTPLILGLVVGVGASIGEFSGYFVGLAGIKSFEAMKNSEIEELKRIRDRLEVVGVPLIAFFSFTPLPFDLIGIAAGLAQYSKLKFFVGCVIGKIPRYVLLAYAGYFGVNAILGFFGAEVPVLLSLMI